MADAKLCPGSPSRVSGMARIIRRRHIVPNRLRESAARLRARQSLKGNAARIAFQTRISKTSQAAVDRPSEIRITNLPPGISNVTELAKEVTNAVSRFSTTKHSIERVHWDRNRRYALVLVSSSRVAKQAIRLGKMHMFGSIVTVSPSTRLMAGVKCTSSQVEPEMYDFPIRKLEVGELADNEFHVFWASSKGARGKGEGRSFIEVRLLSRLLILNLEGFYFVARGNPVKGTFEKHLSRVQVRVPFSSITNSVRYQRNSTSNETNGICLHIRHPPFVFRNVQAGRFGTIWTRKYGTLCDVRLERTIDFTSNSAFGSCSALRVFLDTADGVFKRLTSVLVDARIAPGKFPGGSIIIRSVPQNFVAKRLHDAMKFGACSLGVPFSVRYEVERLISFGALNRCEVSSYEFWQLLGRLPKVEAHRVLELMYFLACEQSDYRINAFLALEYAVQKISSSRLESGVEYQYEQERKTEEVKQTSTPIPRRNSSRFGCGINSKATSNLITCNTSNSSLRPLLVRKLMVTPTRVVPCPSELGTDNRVLRKYREFADLFIRVSFVDEDGDCISYKNSNDLYAQVRRYLRYGVNVAGEKFVFLAFSASQLREHSCWFFNEHPNVWFSSKSVPSANEVRNWFGSLAHIRLPSICAARMGQLFSNTVRALTLRKGEFEYQEDIWDERRMYAFSDGIGMMSTALAERVYAALNLKATRGPSAYQIRFAGAKGVVSIWPNLSTDLVIRKSMSKFGSDHTDLEVVGYSRRLPFFLNRQVITVLEGLGVKAEVFLEIQREYLSFIEKSGNENEDGRKLVGSFRSSFDIKSSNVAPMIDAKLLFNAGLDCDNCELMNDIMVVFQKLAVESILKKARIPLTKAACVLGVLDELSVLGPDEIFVQLGCTKTNDTQIIQGSVVVGRSPCLHPGDIQSVTAKDFPQLRHLVDVVVFPRTGKRPIPTMLSGGDLDGDLYFVIWDKRITSVNARMKPMDYTPAREEPLNREVCIEDIQDFMIRYMRSNNLGQIAVAHLVHCDREKKGIFSSKAIYLAHLHSTAVDFVKKGTPAKLLNKLILRSSEGQYPDFMEKEKSVSYNSGKALGRMYRECRSKAGNIHKKSFQRIGGTTGLDQVINIELPDESELRIDALRLCESWNSNVRAALDAFGIENEAELVTGKVLRFKMGHLGPKGKDWHFEQQQVVNHHMNNLKIAFRKLFFCNLVQLSSGENVQQLAFRRRQKMCAWYFASKILAVHDKKKKKRPVFSFPFVVSDVLLDIVTPMLKKQRTLIKYTEFSY